MVCEVSSLVKNDISTTSESQLSPDGKGKLLLKAVICSHLVLCRCMFRCGRRGSSQPGPACNAGKDLV